jgi:hypothetical protein
MNENWFAIMRPGINAGAERGSPVNGAESEIPNHASVSADVVSPLQGFDAWWASLPRAMPWAFPIKALTIGQGVGRGDV